MVVVRRGAEGEALGRLAAGVDVEQFRRHVVHPFRSAALGLVPLIGAEPVQRRVLLARTGVAGNQVQRRHRHIDLGLFGIFEAKELHGIAVDGEGDEPAIAPDAVVEMHHRRADVEFGHVANDRVRVHPGTAAGFGGRLVAVAKDLRFRDDGDVVQPEAPFERRHHKGRAARVLMRLGAPQEVADVVDLVGNDAGAAQQVVQMRPPTGALRR